MYKGYKKKSLDEKKKEVEILINNAQKRIEKIFDTPENMKEYLSFMTKFYNYSHNNIILIQEQFNGAIAVGSYAFWKEKGLQVNKGEKGIKILVPTRLGDRFENSKGEINLISKATKEEKLKIEKGELEVIEGRLVFKQGYVFDISQTNAKSSDLPKIFPNRWLDGDIENYKTLYKGLEKIALDNGIKIIKPKQELGAAKGVSYILTKEVALNPRNSELQNFKTLIHELTHAKLHRADNYGEYTKNEKEFQAELTAYTVCSYFNIDTSEYSLRYIKDWTKNAKLKDKENLLKEVKETSKEFIDILENTLNNEKEREKMNYKDEMKKKVENIGDEKLKELYEKSIIFDKGGWNELRAIKSVLNKDRSKNNQVSLESMYTVEANMGLFEDMDGKELIPYYEKGYFGDIIDSKIIGGSYEQVTYGGDYTNKKEYKEFRKEVMKEALIDNLMHEDNFFSSIKKYYSDIENKSIKEDERERLNYEFKDEFGVSYKEYMDNKKNEDKVKEDIKNELEKLGRGENKMINKKEEKEILKMVREHEEWLNSRGERGKRLNLEGEDLKGIKFLNLDLRNANFKNADISNCIIYADLKNANFEGVKINEKTKFTGSKNINKMTIEANKLQIIDVQIKEELDKHKIGMKNLKSLKNKDNDIER